MSDMIVLVPSRTRPHNIARLQQAWADTHATAELLVLVDDDDPALEQYRATGVALVVGPRQRIGPLLNEWALQVAGEGYEVVGFMGDDHVPRTPGWDARILEVSGAFSVVYGNDLLQGERIPTAVFMGAALIRTLGYFNPPDCQHLYLDNAWKHYGVTLDTLRYLPDVVIEHMHPVRGKAEVDALYREVNSDQMYASDRAAFQKWLNERAAVDLARCEAAMCA